MKGLKNVVLLILAVISLIITLDFSLPGKAHKESIIDINTKHQSYNNGARNSHVSYTVKTKNNALNTSKDFAQNISKGEVVHFTKSLIFGKINRVHNLDKSISEVYSLRWFSGLILPLLVLLILGLHFILKKQNEFLLIICTVGTIGNLVYLFY